MKKSVILLFLCFFSCEKKMEFIESEAIPALVLVKNPIENDSLLKSQLVNYLIKKQPKKRENQLYKQICFKINFLLILKL